MVENNAKINSGDKVEDFHAKCQTAGLRVTPQRIAVYEALVNSKEHPSADTVYRLVKEVLLHISLDTVNRTLQTLVEIGVAFTTEGSGDTRRFDGNLGNHQHFKCIKCKKIIDLHHESFDNIQVPASIGEKFTVLRKTVYFEGICDLCGETS